jgi:Alr-MurF fusion protein
MTPVNPGHGPDPAVKTKYPEYSTWLELDRTVLAQNIFRLKAMGGARFMAVVKANGCGHGAVEVSKVARAAGADWLGVARVEEGITLRAAGLTLPTLALGYSSPSQAEQAIANDISLTVYDVELAQHYDMIAGALGKTARLHLKVDTGLGRLGVASADVNAFVQMLLGLPNVKLEGIFTHFATADSANPIYALNQLNRFEQTIDGLTDVSRDTLLIHTANSAATLRLPASHYDMVRCGLSMYGLHPSAEVECPPDIKPVMGWKTVVSQVRLLAVGESAGYGRGYIADRARRIAVIPVGYADGFRRLPATPNQVLINGQQLNVVGRECMDQSFVDVSDLPDVAIGDEVVLIGQQGQARISAEDVADRWKTINYEVCTGLGARLPRIWSA